MLGAMSYSITVHAREGHLTVEHSGDVPDGNHVITGHDDDEGRSVEVHRHTPEGHRVAGASAHHSKEH